MCVWHVCVCVCQLRHPQAKLDPRRYLHFIKRWWRRQPTTTMTTVECRRRRRRSLLLLLHCKPKKCLGQKKMPEKHLLLDQAQAHTHTHMSAHKTLLFVCQCVARRRCRASKLLSLATLLLCSLSLSRSPSLCLLFKLSPSNAPPFKLYATCCCSVQHIYIWHCILYGPACRTLWLFGIF